MPALAQLVDPHSYRACTWDLRADAAGRTYWLGHFRRHLKLVVDLVRTEYPSADTERIAALEREYDATMARLEHAPEQFAHVDILLIDQLRGELLQRYGFDDPFHSIKQRENAAALALLPARLAETDALPPARRARRLAEGLLAGNFFDLGAAATIARYHNGQHGFHDSLADQPARPWFIDDVDAFVRRWLAGRPYRHVVFFVDNAGGDVVLGGLPWARWMVQSGTRVTLAANSRPALNDVTAGELVALLGEVRRVDAAIAAALDAGALRVCASGNAAPLIDLSALAPDCVAATRDADLLMLHGMGRAIESNFHARFACDVLRTAVLKDAVVAERTGGRLFDCVFQFTPAM